MLADVRGGFTNPIAMANGKADFRAAVKRGLDDLGLRLIHLEKAESLKTRLSKHSISEDLERTADEVKTQCGRVCQRGVITRS